MSETQTTIEEAERGRQELSSREALDKLKRGEMLQNVCVRRLHFKGDFEQPVRMKNVTLIQVKFDHVHFHDDVVFDRCTLQRINFQQDVHFAKTFSLKHSTIQHGHLRHMTVDGALSCDDIKTRGKLVFSDCVFNAAVRFWDARFTGWVDFARCNFHGEADFRNFTADEGFSLKDCHFHADAIFRGSTVAKKFEASNSRFERLFDLSKSKFHDFIYLENIEQGPDMRFAFYNAVGEKILVRTEQLIGRLDSEKKHDWETAMHEYGLLKRGFAALHRFEQEDWAFYQFKVMERRGVGRSWKRPMTKVGQFFSWLFLDLGCSYGTSPRRAIRMAAIIVLAFGLLYAGGMKIPDNYEAPFAGAHDSAPNRLVYGLLMSVSVFTAGFADLQDMAQGWLVFPLMIEAILGLILWGLFIVAFSRKVIR